MTGREDPVAELLKDVGTLIVGRGTVDAELMREFETLAIGKETEAVDVLPTLGKDCDCGTVKL